MNNNTWVSLSAPAVIVFGLLSAVLFILNQQYGSAVLAIGLSAGLFGILSGMREVLSNLAQLREGMTTLNAEESREFVDAFDSSYGKSSSANEVRDKNASTWDAPASAPVLSAPAAPAPLSTYEPPAPVQPPAPLPAPEPLPAPKKESYKPLAGLSLSSPNPMPQLAKTARLEESKAEPAPAPAPLPAPQPIQPAPAPVPEPLPAPKKEAYKPFTGLSLTAPPPPPAAEKHKPMTAELFTDASIEGMETTKEFLPSELDEGAPSQEQLDTPTIDLAVPAPAYEVPSFDSKPSQPLPPPSPASEAKVRAKLVRKRYSTFAGLALNSEPSAQTVKDDEPQEQPQSYEQEHKQEPEHKHEHEHKHPHQPEFRQPEDRFEAPPPPPPPRKEKERKRYSTFAGLNLTDRDSRPAVPSPPYEEPKATASAAPSPAKAGPSAGPLSILPKREQSPSPPLPESAYSTPAPAPRKGGRKRYQTFMGLSLSRTPQPIKKMESESAPTGPLPAELAGTPPSGPYAAPADGPSAINKGQMGSLVDGFCSLCGSPQAAGNDYSGATSEPEFCWYCGARLRGK